MTTRLTIDYIREWTSDNTESILLSTQFVDNKAKLDFRCQCGNVYKRCWMSFRLSTGKCRDCTFQVIFAKNRFSTEEYQHKLDSNFPHKFTILEEVINARTPILIRNNVTGVEFMAPPYCVANGRISGNGRSKGEIEVITWLNKHDIEYEQQYVIHGASRTGNNLYADFYLPKFNLIIEFDGEQHFVPIAHFGGESAFIKRKENDLLKEKYCLDNSIDLLRIPFYMIESVDYYLNSALLPPEMDEPCFDN